jgi:methyl-accepting chemotaxis protein WspA
MQPLTTALGSLARLDPRTSIGGRLVAWFLLIAFLSCGALAWALYVVSRRALEDTYHDRMNVVAQRKVGALETYALGSLRSVGAVGRTSATADAIRAYAAALGSGGAQSAAYRAADARFRPELARLASVHGYGNAVLVSTAGLVVFALEAQLAGLSEGASLLTGPLRGSEIAGVFDRVGTLLQEEISDFQIYAGAREPMAFVAGPVVDEAGVAGVLMFRIPNEELYDIVGEATGLGDTGETVVATRAGQEAVFVAPLRHDPAAAFTRRVRIGERQSVAIQRAVQGQRGFGPDVDYRGVETLAVWSYIPSFRWGIVLKQDTTEAMALVTTQRRLTLWLLGLMALPVAVAALLVARSISRPVGFAARAAAQVAGGDLTARLESPRRDETGVLVSALQTMITNLRGLLGQVKQSSIQLTSTATRMSATAQAQEESVAQFSGSANEIAAAVHEISATGQELVRTMGEVARRVEHTAALAGAGRAGLGEMEEAVGALAASTGSIAARLDVIAERAQRINGVVLTITKVADQTNLLSLNAAIEASKAGEFGQGFAVVAQEIRRLADQTAVGTLDIEQMVREMQAAVSEGVAEMQQFSAQVARGVETTARTNEQLAGIIEEVQTLTPRFTAVNEGMRSQSQGAQQIGAAMGQLTGVAHATSAAIHEFVVATEDLRHAVGALRQEVSRFKTEA